VVHAHHYEGILVASRADPGVPIIYDAHTLLSGELPHYRIGLPVWLKRAVAGYLDRRLPARADRTIAVSESIRDRLLTIGAVSPERVDVIPSGVDWERFRVDPPEQHDGRTVIFTGNLSRYQRVDLLLEAFAALHARRPEVRLMIVTQSSFAPYESLAQRLGVRGAIDLHNAPFAQQPALLAAAAVAVNPRTHCDGLPQKLLNYMAAAVPIVSFDGSAAHLEHERTGIRVADGDTVGMADAIERLLDDRALAKRLGHAAREQVRRDFSWDGVAARAERVYRAAIAARGAG
jgi:glycosyltransferase involved in cell wall biosynthesis